VDDCCLWSKEQKHIDDLLETFRSEGDEYEWEFTKGDDSISEFLGVDIKPTGDGGYKLLQEGLIKKILKETGMEDCNAKPTPTSSAGPIGQDKLGKRAHHQWSYSSVVGMLLYLASNSRPELAFSVHQVARFTHSPRASHEEAVLRICRYLQGTKTEGLILRPSKELKVDCWVDADFAGLWGYEDVTDPVCVKSRTGFVISIASCPLMWVSKLQQEISTSTQESEFVALSQSMKDLIYVKRLVEEAVGEKGAAVLGLDKSSIKFTTKSTVYEDNNGALALANSTRVTPRTRHYAVKWFWFRQHVHAPDKWVSVVKVDTKNQVADIMTKRLPQETFEYLRKKLCGW